MAGRNRFPRYNKPDPVDAKQDSQKMSPQTGIPGNTRKVGKQDNCCCHWFKPKSKPMSEGGNIPNYMSDAGKLPDNNNNRPGKETEAYQKEYSNGSNQKPSYYHSSSPGLARDQHDNPKEITYKEADHVNGATYASKDNQEFAQDQENSYESHGKIKPSSQSKTTSIHGQGPDESPGKIEPSSQSKTTSIHGQDPHESPGKIKPSSQSKTTSIHGQGPHESPGKIKPSSQSTTSSIHGQGPHESPGKIKPSSQSTTTSILGQDPHESPRKIKPSSQSKTTTILGQGPLGSTDQREDNRQEGMNKNGKHRGPNSTSETRSGLGYSPFEEQQQSNALLKEDNNGSHGGTGPDPAKNKGKGNNGSHGGTRSDPSKAFEEAGPPSHMDKSVKHSYVDPLEGQHKGVKHSYVDPLEGQNKGVHKREYNREIHRDTRPDLS